MKPTPLKTAIITAAAAFALPLTSRAVPTIGTFSSSADLDLTGTFAYALDIGGPGGFVVNGLTFTDDETTAGVTASSDHNNFPYQTPNYDGGTNAEDALEAITNTIRWDQDGTGLNDVTVSLDVQAGTPYKLQLLFQDDTGNRGTDVFFDGVLAVDDFKSGTGTLTSGTLITDTITPAGNTLTIQLDGTDAAGFSDKNAILSALTLEVVPEPTTFALLAAGLPILFRRRRR